MQAKACWSMIVKLRVWKGKKMHGDENEGKEMHGRSLCQMPRGGG